MEQKERHYHRVNWGTGRVAFRANLPTIQEMLDAGWPMSTVYHQIKSSLAGVSYRSFTDHVNKYLYLAKQSKKEATKQIVEPLVQRGPTSEEKPTTSGKPTRFKPGPRVPDPSKLY